MNRVTWNTNIGPFNYTVSDADLAGFLATLRLLGHEPTVEALDLDLALSAA